MRSGVGLILSTLVVVCSVAAAPSQPNVLLITIDTTRADRLGCYGHDFAVTPTLDALAAEGILFEEAFSAVPLTGPSHATILTGLNPPGHGVRANTQFRGNLAVPTLATILKGAGYRTGAVIAAMVLNRMFGMAVGFDDYLDRIEGQAQYQLAYAEIPAKEVTRRAKGWLASATDSRPFFLWVHYFDPHAPYRPPGADTFLPPEFLYDQEIAYMDEAIKELLDVLPLDTYENTIVVVAGDHGESFGQHGEKTHGMLTYDGALHVPLIIRPAQASFPAGRVSEMVGLIDILPTILDMVGQPIPDSVHGASLVPLLRGEAGDDDRELYFECMGGHYVFGWGKITGIRTPRYKLILAPVPELYDLVADLLEEDDLYDPDSDLTEDMLLRYELLAEEVGADADEILEATTFLSPADEERLRTLGYIGRRPGTRAQEHLNPKDNLHLFYAVLQFHDKLYLRQFAEVERGCRELIAEDPHNLDLVELLTTAMVELGKADEAATMLEEFLEHHPDVEFLRRDLGVIYLSMGWLTEASKVWQELVDQGTKDPQVYERLADLHLRSWQGHPADANLALKHIEQAMQLGSTRYDLMGRIYLALGQPERGVELLQANMHDCIDNLSDCEEVLAGCKQAVAKMNHSAQTDPE